ncbi:hypothetical protein PFISCL1PPCAC_17646, partial [Pristionchus fissidentatus]
LIGIMQYVIKTASTFHIPYAPFETVTFSVPMENFDTKIEEFGKLLNGFDIGNVYCYDQTKIPLRLAKMFTLATNMYMCIETEEDLSSATEDHIVALVRLFNVDTFSWVIDQEFID